MSKFLLGLTLFLASILISSPVMAVQNGKIEPRTPTESADPTDSLEPTFSATENPDGDEMTLRFGDNSLMVGNTLNSNSAVSGLLFSFGNQISLKTKAEYAFVAGYTVDFSAETSKDLFIAGNFITISDQARVGRDVYAAGNQIALLSDIDGDFSATGDKIILRDVNIAGNANFDARRVIIEGKVNIGGALNYNEGCDISGLTNANYAEISTYISTSGNSVNLSDLWLGCLFGILGLFLAMLVILLIFPRASNCILEQASDKHIAASLLTGLVFLFFTPIAAILLVMTFIGAPVALALLAVYLIVMYLSQGFTGLWLGNLITSKLLHLSQNPILDTFIGIVIIKLLGLLPFVGGIVSIIAVILGAGFIIRALLSCRRQHPKEDVIKEAEVISKSQPKTSSKSKKSE